MSQRPTNLMACEFDKQRHIHPKSFFRDEPMFNFVSLFSASVVCFYVLLRCLIIHVLIFLIHQIEEQLL